MFARGIGCPFPDTASTSFLARPCELDLLLDVRK